MQNTLSDWQLNQTVLFTTWWPLIPLSDLLVLSSCCHISGQDNSESIWKECSDELFAFGITSRCGCSYRAVTAGCCRPSQLLLVWLHLAHVCWPVISLSSPLCFDVSVQTHTCREGLRVVAKTNLVLSVIFLLKCGPESMRKYVTCRQEFRCHCEATAGPKPRVDGVLEKPLQSHYLKFTYYLYCFSWLVNHWMSATGRLDVVNSVM